VKIALNNAKLPDGGDGSLYFENGLICESKDVSSPNYDAEVYYLKGNMVCPGFVDEHMHGMHGINVNDATVDDFIELSRRAPQYGTTALLPTTVACSADELRRVILNFREALPQCRGAQLLGINMESNFINPEARGAQPAKYIYTPDSEEAGPIIRLIEQNADVVRLITVAPEMPGALELIARLVQAGITVSLGHTAATYEQGVAGVKAGATRGTHTFNAMTAIHHREPGIIPALTEFDTDLEVVCDGHHVDSAIVRMLYQLVDCGRIIAITDSLSCAGGEDGAQGVLGGQPYTVKSGVARLDENNKIAGSMATMDCAFRFLIQGVGLDTEGALCLTSANPAGSLGLHAGSLNQGYLADVVVLDDELQVMMTFVGGELVYQRE